MSGCGTLIIVCIGLFLINEMPVLAVIFGIFVVCAFANNVLKESSASATSLNDELIKIQNMRGLDFESYAADILKKNGFSSVKVTKGSGDFGADIIAQLDGNTYVIQCKKYEKNVGISAVQQIYAAKSHYSADCAAVLTNAYFTPAAKRLAEETGVALWDRNTLSALIKNTIQVRQPKTNENKSEIEKNESSPLYAVLLLLFFIIAIMILAAYLHNTEEPSKIDSTLSSVQTTQSPEATFMPTSAPSNTMHYQGIMRKNANVRQEPDAESMRVGVAKAGEKITITEPYIVPKWHKVIFNGEEAYISANYCLIQDYEEQ